MNSPILHFTSDIEFNLSINGNFLEFVDNKSKFSLDVIPYEKNLFVTFNPVASDTTYLSYTQNIQIENHIPKSKSDFIKIIPFTENHYEVFLKPVKYNNEQDEKTIFNEMERDFNIIISNNITSNLQVFHAGKCVYKKKLELMNIASSKLINSTLIIKTAADNDRFFILIFDTIDKKAVLETYCNSIEEENDVIEILKFEEDIAKHGKVFKYNSLDKSLENFMIYKNNHPTKTSIVELIPMAFLEAVKFENFNLAKNYLDTKLQNASDLHYKNYFGNIKNIYFNKYTNKAYYNYTIESDVFKNYNFDIENNKITEIDNIF